jgi:hypothetical protein
VNVTLTPQASAYVRERGGALTVRPSPRHGCCGGTVDVPLAEVGPPADTAGFALQEGDGVRVYLALDLPPDIPLRVGLDRLFGLAALFVEEVQP